MRRSLLFLLFLVLPAASSCATPGNTPPPTTAPPAPYPQPYPPAYGQPPYGQAYPGNTQPPYGSQPPPGYGQPYTYPPPPYAPAPQQPPPAQPPPVAQTPLLPPLVGGPPAWQAETRAVLAELISHLSADNAARVRGIPLVFDPHPNEVNAFAGCDANGPFLAGTEGLLEAVDAISQTQANDDLYGTHLYDTYCNAVAPVLASPNGGSAALPLGILPPATLADPRRLSHARELFDEIVAFTFGHELGHHYLGHTGCANGQASGLGPAAAVLDQALASVVPLVNQPNEMAADRAGAINVLDTGKARVPSYRWTERGGLTLLDFFARLERAAGASPLGPLADLLRTHPNPAVRIPLVREAAMEWHLWHPG